MTIKEKIQQEKVYINTYNFKLTKESAEKFEKIADDLAIKFAEWVVSRAYGEDGLKLKDDVLQKFKKEKGL